MENINSGDYINGHLYDLVLRNNIVYHSFLYDAIDKAFVKGEFKIYQHDVSMFREV